MGRARLERPGSALGRGRRDASGSSSRRRSRPSSPIGEHDRAIRVAPLDLREVRSQCASPLLVPEREARGHLSAEEIPELLHVRVAERCGHQPATAADDACKLADAEIEIGHVVEHPVRGDAVELTVREGKALDVGDLRVDPAGPASARPSAARCRRRRPRRRAPAERAPRARPCRNRRRGSVRARFADGLEDGVIRVTPSVSSR